MAELLHKGVGTCHDMLINRESSAASIYVVQWGTLQLRQLGSCYSTAAPCRDLNLKHAPNVLNGAHGCTLNQAGQEKGLTSASSTLKGMPTLENAPECRAVCAGASLVARQSVCET
eukprot:362384-Chlamydomonas_euryale.AAC.5